MTTDRQAKAGSRLLAAAVLLVVVGGLMGCRGQIKTKPPIHPNWNMDQQHRYDPQEPSSFFDDGRSMRAPVAGTVPAANISRSEPGDIGYMADNARDDEHFHHGTIGGQNVNSLPPQVTLDRDLLERGQERFEIFCQPCHGMAGEGDGIVPERGLLRPPSLHDERLRAEPLGHLYRVITYGVRAGSVSVDGGGNMGPYGSQIRPYDRWAVAAYVRALQVTTLAGVEAGASE